LLSQNASTQKAQEEKIEIGQGFSLANTLKEFNYVNRNH